MLPSIRQWSRQRGLPISKERDTRDGRHLTARDALPPALTVAPAAPVQGKMVAVIPFVGKVMEACKDSLVFRPTNPWVSPILSLLAEVHALEKLKLNITFEIELICQNMAVKVADLKPSADLKGRKVPPLRRIPTPL